MNTTTTRSMTRFPILAAIVLLALSAPVMAQEIREYPCEEDLIEVMFDIESMVRLEGAELVDHSGLNADADAEMVVMAHGGGEWSRLLDLPEPLLDERLSNVPDLERVVVQGAGHFVHMERPKETARILLDWLDS